MANLGGVSRRSKGRTRLVLHGASAELVGPSPARVSPPIRILFLADTHLGFDLPLRPKVERRRRGYDFLANYARALEPALNGEVDLVVHGGDVFDRSRVVESLAWQAYEPLRSIAERGIPVCIVPGNHERSRLPHTRFLRDRNVHVFDHPRTVIANVKGVRVALSGFPFERGDVRTRFPSMLAATGWRDAPADARILVVHHCVEGATVGPSEYTFTTSGDVIRHADIPRDFAAVFSGHIHRHQVLTRDLSGRALAVPVLYPGSIERTALAEIGEVKGCLDVQLNVGVASWAFRPLPVRPMHRIDLDVEGLCPEELEREVRLIVDAAPRDAVLAIRLTGVVTAELARAVSAPRLRTFVPPTMNVDVHIGEFAIREEPYVSRPATGVQLSFADSMRA